MTISKKEINIFQLKRENLQTTLRLRLILQLLGKSLTMKLSIEFKNLFRKTQVSLKNCQMVQSTTAKKVKDNQVAAVLLRCSRINKKRLSKFT